MFFIRKRIEKAKEKLNKLVEKGLTSDETLKTSQELDKLVVQYYKQKERKKYGYFKNFNKIKS